MEPQKQKRTAEKQKAVKSGTDTTKGSSRTATPENFTIFRPDDIDSNLGFPRAAFTGTKEDKRPTAAQQESTGINEISRPPTQETRQRSPNLTEQGPTDIESPLVNPKAAFAPSSAEETTEGTTAAQQKSTETNEISQSPTSEMRPRSANLTRLGAGDIELPSGFPKVASVRRSAKESTEGTTAAKQKSTESKEISQPPTSESRPSQANAVEHEERRRRRRSRKQRRQKEDKDTKHSETQRLYPIGEEISVPKQNPSTAKGTDANEIPVHQLHISRDDEAKMNSISDLTDKYHKTNLSEASSVGFEHRANDNPKIGPGADNFIFDDVSSLSPEKNESDSLAPPSLGTTFPESTAQNPAPGENKPVGPGESGAKLDDHSEISFPSLNSKHIKVPSPSNTETYSKQLAPPSLTSSSSGKNEQFAPPNTFAAGIDISALGKPPKNKSSDPSGSPKTTDPSEKKTRAKRKKSRKSRTRRH